MSDSNKWLLLVLTSIAWLLIYILSPVLMPFLIAALLAYLGDPIVDKFEHYGMPRTVAVTSVFLLILVFIAVLPFIVIPLLEQQLAALVEKIPNYINWLYRNVVPMLNQAFGVDVSLLDGEQIKKIIADNWRQFGSFANQIYASLSHSGLALVAWLINLAIVPVVTFYLLRDWDILIEKVHMLLPRRYELKISRIAKESDEVLGAFLRGQLSVMVVLGGVYTVGLWILGIDLALLIGMAAGIVSFVPYLGFIIGLLLAGLAAIIQFNDILYLLGVGVVFGIGQALESMLLTPILVGDKIGLHPVAVIFAVMAGGQLFGFTGVLLALPFAAVIMVLLRHLHDYYTQSQLYSHQE